MLSTRERLLDTGFPALQRGHLSTLQVNLGYRCNQQCVHCHVNAGPNRTEVMTAEIIGNVVDFISASGIETLDLTGGAPELNPGFRELVRTARDLGKRVIDRCNLTVLLEPGYEDLASFLAGQKVEIVASLPCYLEENVDRQRGKGVFASSIRALQQLNALGYGQPGGELVLSLVFNPQGTLLPPPQATLEADYRKFLGERYNIVFTQLYTLANMPIARFGSMLMSRGTFNGYMDTLRAAHRDENLAGVMCRELISVDWQGYVYDCDFNQMLNLPMTVEGRRRPHLRDLLETEVTGLPICVAEHCYGCTAGQGSSCGGALAE